MSDTGNKLLDLPDFSGKVLSISIMDDDASHDLISPTFSMQGGRLFLSGMTPQGATTSDWAEGVVNSIAWDRVTEYMAFETLERYLTATKISRDYNARDDNPT